LKEISNREGSSINVKKIVEDIERGIKGSVVFKIFFVNPSYNPIDNNDYKIAKLNINDSVVEVLKGALSELTSFLSEKQQISIAEIEKEDEEYIVTVPVSEVDKIHDYISMIEKEEYTSFNAHDCDVFLDKLKFYIIQLKINGEEYYLIKRYSVNKLITPKKVYLVCKENTFEHLDNQSILVLDSNFDALVYGDTVYVINDKQFSIMTSYYEKEKAQATTILDSIESEGIIKDFDKLREHCGERISYTKRLSKVDVSVLKKLNYNKIARLKRKRGTDFILDNKTKTVSFDNVEQLKNVIDLILDNFVVSELTDEAYRALNKFKEKKEVS
jgi:hypothetical protein